VKILVGLKKINLFLFSVFSNACFTSLLFANRLPNGRTFPRALHPDNADFYFVQDIKKGPDGRQSLA